MSYEVLARKYRPQTFDDVTGQKLVIETLKNAIRQDRVAHGYVFSGARGVGKTTTARILAKALNCSRGPTVTPCGECDSCREIAAARAVDVLEIDAASNRGIDEIRELRENVRYLPSRDRKKIFIIDEVHMLTPEAFNALLKTLEEPPESALFILATTEPHKIPTTILSRCQHFAFRLLDYAENLEQVRKVADREQIQYDEASLSLIAQAAAGSVRDAFSLLDQAIAYSGTDLKEDAIRQLLGAVPTQILEELLAAVQASDGAAVLDLIERLVRQGFELQHFSSELTQFIRNLMVTSLCGPEPDLLPVPEQTRSRLKELAQKFSPEDLTRFLQIMLRAQTDLRYAPEPRFHLELALLKLVHARRLEPLENLLVDLRQESPGTMAVNPRPALKSSGSSAVQGASAPADVPATQPIPSDGASAALPPLGGPNQKQLAAIKSLVHGRSKLLSNFLEHNLVGWRCEDGQTRFVFSDEVRWALDILAQRENQEVLRGACAEVLGEPVRLSISVEEEGKGKAVGNRLSASERARRDPQIRAVMERFDGAWLGAKNLTGSEP